MYRTEKFELLLSQLVHEGECYSGGYEERTVGPNRFRLPYNYVLKRRKEGDRKAVRCGVTLIMVRKVRESHYDVTRRGTHTHDLLSSLQLSERLPETVAGVRTS